MGFISKIKEKIRGIVGISEYVSGSSNEYGEVDAVGTVDGTRVLVGYVLWHQPFKGHSRSKVKEFSYLPDDEEIDRVVNEYGKSGTYMLQEMWIDKGLDGRKDIKQFGKVVKKMKYDYDYSDDDELEIEEVVSSRRRRRKSDLDSIAEFVESIERMSEHFEKLGEVGIKLAKLSGKPVVELPDGRNFEDYVIDMMDNMKKKWEKLDSLFGKSRVKGGEAEIPVDGKIPAWMVYAPQLADRIMDNVERRLEKFGLIEKNEEVKSVPEFPKLE